MRGEVLIKTDPSKSRDPSVAEQRFFVRRLELISKLSSLIDRGRFLFPNYELAGIGENKGAANRGLRDPVLNRVVAALEVVSAVDYIDYKRNFTKLSLGNFDAIGSVCIPSETRAKMSKAFRVLSGPEIERLRGKSSSAIGVNLLELLVACKRSFVSEVFTVIQPQDWLKTVDQNYAIQLRSRKPERIMKATME